MSNRYENNCKPDPVLWFLRIALEDEFDFFEWMQWN